MGGRAAVSPAAVPLVVQQEVVEAGEASRMEDPVEARAPVASPGLEATMLGLVAACPGRAAIWVAAACMALVALLPPADPGQAVN
jgi:hypothetical protein